MKINASLSNQIQEPSDHSSTITKHSSLETGDVRDAAKLLHLFDAVSLGEGNLNAGANTLAAMALTLANIAPPRTCLVDSGDGTRVPVGMNVLVSGALSGSLIKDRAIAPLQSLQDSLFGHIRQRLERRKQGEKRITEASAFLGIQEDPAPPTVLDRLGKDNHFNEKHFEAELRTLLRPPANAGVSEITEAPVMFAGIGSVEGLHTAMGFANRGRLLAHVNVTGIKGGTLLGLVCDELVSGCPNRKQLAMGIRGEVLATTPAGMLDSLLAEQSDHGWLERMLWLVEHPTGPEPEITGDTKNGTKLGQVGHFFDAALEELVARRINFHKPQPMTLGYRFAQRQVELNSFLARLEHSFPGIAGALRPLWASLLFGLTRILEAVPAEELPRFNPRHVDAYARMLAMRMVNARAVILDEHRRKLIENLAASFRLKLMEGPHTVRDLMRRSNDLDADTVRKSLERLADSGLAVRRGREWQLAPSTPSRGLTLNA